MPKAVHIIVVILCALSYAVWTGGYAELPLVTRIARATLSPQDAVAYFRRLGRVHGIIGTGALVVWLITGGILMTQIHWGAVAYTLAVLAAILVVSLALGVVQARRMTRMRARLVQEPGDPQLSAAIDRSAQQALVLRAGLGVVTLAMTVLAAVLIG